jgi:hydroxymethylpyrimidine/phosphomethylpyrimidine kinase
LGEPSGGDDALAEERLKRRRPLLMTLEPEMPIAVTIAGSDSGGGAGIQADLKTFSALGVYGASVITALTAQNTREISGVLEVPESFVTRQIDAVYSDLDVAATKIGMLARKEIVTAVAEGSQPPARGSCRRTRSKRS